MVLLTACFIDEGIIDNMLVIGLNIHEMPGISGISFGTTPKDGKLLIEIQGLLLSPC